MAQRILPELEWIVLHRIFGRERHFGEIGRLLCSLRVYFHHGGRIARAFYENILFGQASLDVIEKFHINGYRLHFTGRRTRSYAFKLSCQKLDQSDDDCAHQKPRPKFAIAHNEYIF